MREPGSSALAGDEQAKAAAMVAEERSVRGDVAHMGRANRPHRKLGQMAPKRHPIQSGAVFEIFQ